MARALAEKIRVEQHKSHTVISTITTGSTCIRCGGLMVTDFCMDLLFCIGETEFAAQRCVQCGEIVDPVIIRNRGITENPKAHPTGVDDRLDEAMQPYNRSRKTEQVSFFASRKAPRILAASPAEVDRPPFTPRRGLSAQ